MIGVAHKEALNISELEIVASSENKAAQALTVRQLAKLHIQTQAHVSDKLVKQTIEVKLKGRLNK